MAYPKKQINNELKFLAKKYDLENISIMVLSEDKDVINYLCDVFQHTPYVNKYLKSKDKRAKETISHNMKIYNKLIKKEDND